MTSEQAIKAPIFLTFISSLVVLGASLAMKDSFDREKMGALETMSCHLEKTVQAGDGFGRLPCPLGF